MENQTLIPIEKKTEKTEKKARDPFEYILYVFVIFALVMSAFAFSSLFKLYYPTAAQTVAGLPTSVAAASAMTMTKFDKQLARQMMDKDGDGMCDACGMPVDLCMDSGQLQCNMDPKSTIGILGSQHIHADFKAYIGGKSLDFSNKAHMERMRSGQPVSSFIHVDSGAPSPEQTGDVLHMHATGVPLWMFFESIGIALPTGTQVYVNGKEISDWQNYIFNDLDKILIADRKGDITQQLNLITDFAKIH